MSTAQTAVATLPRVSLIEKMAAKYSVEPAKMLATLKATAFKVKEGEVTNEQMMALLVVADQYGLNPWTKEIFAFPDKGGIVPVVGVDGWTRIVNEHPEFNGVEFDYGGDPLEWIECHIYRKDREHPIKVRELMAECRRETGPWKSHPSRMLRHKAFIQCARLAFGFAGVYDEDEAERIIAAQVVQEQPQRGAAGLKNALIQNKGPTPAEAQADAQSDAGERMQAAHSKVAKPAGTLEQREQFVKKFKDCKDTEILALVRDEVNLYQWTDADREAIDVAYSKRQDELEKS